MQLIYLQRGEIFLPCYHHRFGTISSAPLPILHSKIYLGSVGFWFFVATWRDTFPSSLNMELTLSIIIFL